MANQIIDKKSEELRKMILRDQARSFVAELEDTFTDYAEECLNKFNIHHDFESLYSEIFNFNGFDISIEYGYRQKEMEESKAYAEVWLEEARDRVEMLLHRFYVENAA